MHAIERLAAVGLGRSAPAGADRIDHDKIGEGEPGRGIVPHARRGRVVTGKLEDARADQAQVQIGRCRARSAVEGEGDGTGWSLGVLGDIGGVIDRGRALARLIEKRERSRGRGIGQRAAGNRDGVLGHRVRRQQPQHALAGVGLSLFPVPRFARLLLAVLRRLAGLLRARDRGGAGEKERQQRAGELGGDQRRRGHHGVQSMLQRPRCRTIADRALPAQIPSSVDNRRDIGECRVPPALRRTRVMQKKHRLAGAEKMPFPKASRALERFTVLDLTRVRAGPTCVRQLADWGANVIKIELPPEPTAGEGLGGPREGSDFQNLHRNKRSMTLNLKAPAGVAALKRMVRKADVVVENFRPDVKRRLGIDYPALRRINPKLVYASISGFGQTGPYANRPGFDQIAQGMGGLMSITGLPGQGPVRVGIPVADLSAGLFCALGILVALLERETSKKGQHIATSLLQAQIFMLDFQAARWLIAKEVPKQAGNDHPTSIPTGVFKTTDGYINIAAAGQVIWERFCRAVGAPELIADPDYAKAADRSRNRDALNAIIAEIVATRSSDEWIAILNKAGVPCGPIYSIDAMFADPQVEHLGIATDVAKATGETFQVVGQPVLLSRTPSKIAAPPPELGQHTEEVLREFGFSAQEIATLRRSKVI